MMVEIELTSGRTLCLDLKHEEVIEIRNALNGVIENFKPAPVTGSHSWLDGPPRRKANEAEC